MPNSSVKFWSTLRLSSEKRISVSVGNWARIPPAALLVVPLPTVSRSRTTTSRMPAPGEVVGDAAADHAAADDDDACCLGLVHG